MKRILFVDDEPMVLEGLERMLRRYRKDWQPAFATSGRQALEMLAAARYNVIVTDIRMPEMDGVELLEQVRILFPAMTRVVLSGQGDEALTTRAAPIAHAVLAMPCHPSMLRTAIDRTGDGPI